MAATCYRKRHLCMCSMPFWNGLTGCCIEVSATYPDNACSNAVNIWVAPFSSANLLRLQAVAIGKSRRKHGFAPSTRRGMICERRKETSWPLGRG